MNAPSVIILTGLRAECDMLEEVVDSKTEPIISEKRFLVGTFGETPIAFTWTGMGKVNAALIATLSIHHFQPDVIISAGIAGGLNPDIVIGDVVIRYYGLRLQDSGALIDRELRLKLVETGYKGPL